MLRSLKTQIKTALDASSPQYEVLACIYHGDFRGVLNALSIRLKRDSTFGERDLGMAGGCPKLVLDMIVDAFRPSSVLDVGCGLGCTVEYLLQKGIVCVGVEGSAAAIRQSRVQHHIVTHNLKYPLDLGRTFSMVWSFEVAEHIHPDYVDTFVATLTKHSDRIVMSAAPPGQSGVGHFNLQPKGYWIQKLARHNFIYETSISEQIHNVPEGLSGNFMVFRLYRASALGECGVQWAQNGCMPL